MMPQKMCAIIKAKGGQIKYKSVRLSFWPGSVYQIKLLSLFSLQIAR